MVNSDSLLLSILDRCQGNTVLVADENCLDFPFPCLDKSVQIVSNRFDVATQARNAGLDTRFSDYDLSIWNHQSVDNIVYRISKEKPVVHHIANQALDALRDGGSLWLLGGKQEGIKTFAKTIAELFGDRGGVDKEGQLYIARITKRESGGRALDDREYRQLREIFAIGEKAILSKPGQFGWNKTDVGSELLISYLPKLLPPSPSKLSLLDLGCGYGYLSLMANRLRNFAITATDNCAAALMACEANFNLHEIDGHVVADDCAAGISEQFDWVLCNPPFHQGFQQERRLTEKFLGTTRRLLKTSGRALFVVNQFVPLETLAREYFGNISVPVTERGFKLVTLSIR